MSFDLRDLDATTREVMLRELRGDIEEELLLESRRTRPGTAAEYQRLLLDEFATGNCDSLVGALAASGIFLEHQPSNGARINVQAAAEVLGDGQFVAYYCRAVAARAISEGREVEIYRGQLTAKARSESDALIGTRPDPAALLEDLRSHSQEPWLFANVAKANSGLAIHLV